MIVITKRLFQKTEKTGDESKKDLSQSNQVFGSLSSYRSSEPGSFWGSKKGRVWIAGFIVCIIGAVVISFVFYKEGSKKEIIKVTPTPIPIEAVQEAIPTPEEIDISKYKIEILNGSGIGGEAAKAKTLLEKEGFVVAAIGNADNASYKETIIKAKKQTPQAFTDKLRINLEKTYSVSSTSDISDPENTDIIIIIGADKTPQ